MKTFSFCRRFSLFAALLIGAALVPIAKAAPENGAADEAAQGADVTLLPETDGADATVLPDVKTQLTPQQRRARLAERRRQSEEQLLSLLREVGGDVPQLRESLRDFLTDEARARRPMRAQGNRLLSALRIGVSNAKITTPEEAMLKLHEVLRREMPPVAADQNAAPDAGTLDSELRVSLRQQKPDANAAGDDSVRVLAQHDNDQLRALVATLRQMQADERAQRAAREAQLDMVECCGIDAHRFWPEDIARATQDIDRISLLNQLTNIKELLLKSSEQVVVYHRLNQLFDKRTFLEFVNYLIKGIESSYEI